MKKALVLVQGINHGLYLKDALTEVDFHFNDYDEVVEVPTEAIFDGNKGIIESKFNLWDWVGDAYQFYAYSFRRREVCKLTRKYILDLQNQGFQVDALAHSLGCQILICCGSQKSSKGQIKLENTILLAPPMGLGFVTLRAWIRSHAKKFSKNFYSRKLEYYWSKEDFISKIYDNKVNTLIDNLSYEHANHSTNTDHSVQDFYHYIKSNTRNV